MKLFHFSINTHKRLNIAIGCLTVVLWGVLLYFSLRSDEYKKTVKTSHVVQYATPTGTPKDLRVPMVSSAPLIRHSSPTISHYSLMPQPTMYGTSSMRLHETSRAVVNTVGNKGGNENNTGNNSNNTSNAYGNGTNGISYGGNMLALSSSLALAAPGSSTANNLSQLAATPESRRKIVTPPKPSDPVPNPVGDVAWALMALLAATYAFIVYRKRTHA